MNTTLSITFLKNNQIIEQCEVENTSTEENSINFNFLEYNTFLDIEQEIFIRENEEYKFTLNIKKKECKINLKKENLDFDIEVNECLFAIDKDKITLEYVIESDDARNKIIISR